MYKYLNKKKFYKRFLPRFLFTLLAIFRLSFNKIHWCLTMMLFFSYSVALFFHFSSCLNKKKRIRIVFNISKFIIIFTIHHILLLFINELLILYLCTHTHTQRDQVHYNFCFFSVWNFEYSMDDDRIMNHFFRVCVCLENIVHSKWIIMNNIEFNFNLFWTLISIRKHLAIVRKKTPSSSSSSTPIIALLIRINVFQFFK